MMVIIMRIIKITTIIIELKKNYILELQTILKALNVKVHMTIYLI